MADTPEETVAEPVTPFEMAKALRVDADRRLDCGLPLAASMLRLAADALDRQAAEITALRAEIERLTRVATFLWDRLDSIDTVSDAAKSDDAAYRDAVERIQQRRFEVGSTDGYGVSFDKPLPSPPAEG